jgi:hypothetical protein
LVSHQSTSLEWGMNCRKSIEMRYRGMAQWQLEWGETVR